MKIPIIAKFAAERATDQEIENIRKIENKFEEEANEGIYNPETDKKLHVEISKASHNDLFIKFTNDINNVMKEHKMWIFLRDRTVTRLEYRDINVSEHMEIVKSIESCDGEEAMKKMPKHMNSLYDRYWKE
ncbi:FadR/GntR family transcriptional regulator [Clostridium ljungdahlii]|uniref:Predicted transcriptional regulator n=1 Tax=Clostridium ljungdahlii (strain ATCC 55383 / DSM 13528 / PETC) TaxID=748727 RepID=D8GNC8_CLOLD|nr:FCD domain-containing protein [Clostridium ljungdahlii]ADK13752.1 predicted transcriptional regulator [Clostridium ljungdahlii DSM 13528]OAA85000.1 transcriptional regulator NanR [Clostridium ljungdahlii DSM 13528]